MPSLMSTLGVETLEILMRMLKVTILPWKATQFSIFCWTYTPLPMPAPAAGMVEVITVADKQYCEPMSCWLALCDHAAETPVPLMTACQRSAVITPLVGVWPLLGRCQISKPPFVSWLRLGTPGPSSWPPIVMLPVSVEVPALRRPMFSVLAPDWAAMSTPMALVTPAIPWLSTLTP